MSDSEDIELPVLCFSKGFSRNWNDIDLRKKDDNEEFCRSQSALSENLHELNAEHLVEEEIEQVPSFYSQDRDIVCEEPEEHEVFDEEKTWKKSLLRKRLSRDNYDDYLHDSKDDEEEKHAPLRGTKDPGSPNLDVISIDSSDTKQQFTSSLGLDTLKEKIGNNGFYF